MKARNMPQATRVTQVTLAMQVTEAVAVQFKHVKQVAQETQARKRAARRAALPNALQSCLEPDGYSRMRVIQILPCARGAAPGQPFSLYTTTPAIMMASPTSLLKVNGSFGAPNKPRLSIRIATSSCAIRMTATP